MMILSMDLGKLNTVCCFYETKTRKHRFETVATTVSLSAAVWGGHPERGALARLRDLLRRSLRIHEGRKMLCNVTLFLIATERYRLRIVSPTNRSTR